MRFFRNLIFGMLLVPILMGTIYLSTVNAGTPLPDSQAVNIPYKDEQTLSFLAQHFDVIEVDRTLKMVKAIVSGMDRQTLLNAGLNWTVDRAYTTEINTVPTLLPGQTSGIPGYPCYRKIGEIYQAADQLVLNYPALAKMINIGESWEKVNLGGTNGYDLRVLRLGNLENSLVPKSDIFIMSGIHAREWAPPEINLRFAEYLLSNYGIDADVSWLLDYNNVHLLLVTNPDGRDRDEKNTTLLWRKNTDNNYCGNTVNRGADLNRNFPFRWVSYNSECDEVYPGPNSSSEPETTAILNYVRSIFPDQRGPGDYDSVDPATAAGIFIDLHSYSRLVLWSWGDTLSDSPNEVQLRTLGYKFAYYNGHIPQKSAALYPTNGTTGDWAYGELGIPGYCFEVGDSFHQSCFDFGSDIYPRNLQALLRALKLARKPLLLSYGPEVLNLSGPMDPIPAGQDLVVTATIDDTHYSNYNGGVLTQYISRVKYSIDLPSWISGSAPIEISKPSSSSTLDVTLTISTMGLAPGRHVLFVEGKDTTYGPPSAIYFTIRETEPSPLPIVHWLPLVINQP